MIDIADILSPEGVFVDLEACSSKRQALKQLANHAAGLVDIDTQQLLEALMERERLGTTGVGHGIAIPHARLDQLDKVVGIFARLDQPIDFEALDDQPADLIFMLLAPNSADADSLKALARVSRVLRDVGLQKRLRQTKDAGAVYRMLTEKPESHAA